MPIDYSKWNNIDDSDDEDAPAKKASPKPVVTAQGEKVAAPQPTEPQEAAGSSWNLNSWHFEESKFDKWGADRLKSLLDKAATEVIIEFNDNEYDAKLVLHTSKIEGEAWTHVRKGKKATGYSYEISIQWVANVGRGDMSAQLNGQLEYDLTVDDDEPAVTFHCAHSGIPFIPQVKKAVMRFVTDRCAVMIKELSEKGGGPGWKGAPDQQAAVQVGQYKKYTDGVDGTALSAKVAAQLQLGDGDKVKQKKLHTDVKTV